MIKMKIPRLLFIPAFLSLTTSGLADDDLPKTEKFARYQPMLKHSPFAVATAGAPADTTAAFAKDLYVANAAHSADGDFVSLGSTADKNFKEYLNTKEAVHGFTISNIQWSDHVGETKVTISKEGQFATLTFNEALLSQGIQNPAPQTGQPPAVIQGRPPSNIPLPPMPQPRQMGVPTPPPHVRPPIRRKGGAEQAARAVPSVPPAADDDADDTGGQ